MNLKLQGEDGELFPEMGCYGIGVSRIVAAAIEQNYDEKGIIWPNSISPYQASLVEVNPKKNQGITEACQALYNSLKEEGCEVLWDDRDQRAGVKFSDMELIGIPLMIIIGEKSYKENKVELKRRGQDKVELISPNEVALKIVA